MLRTAFVFPGQGSQRTGMLIEPPELDDMPRLLDAAEALSELDLRVLDLGGSDEELADTRAAQPLLYLSDLAWGTSLFDVGVEPVALAGHSLGEYVALALAGVFSPEAGLELVIERSRLMAQAAAATPGSMAAVLGLDGAQVAAALEHAEGVWLANDNCPGQVVVSGTVDGVAQAVEALSAAGAKRVVPLAVSGAFHSPLMRPAAEAFAEVLAAAEFADAEFPVVQNSEPTPATDAEVIRERLARQMTEPVRWTETMSALSGMGVEMLIEAGPGDVLTGLARRFPALEAVSLSREGIEAVHQEVG